MNIAAYCRVSTDKEDQLAEYTQRTGDILVRLYADEGISGTKIKNRKEFLKMMSEAERGFFDLKPNLVFGYDKMQGLCVALKVR